MATQIITVLCEGPHDVAFICRILKTIGFRSNESTKIGEYPSPFDKLLVNEAVKTDVEQLNLTEIRRNLLPTNALKKSDSYVFLYSLEGDGKKEPRQRILKELRSFISAEGEIEILPPDTSLLLLYFFDADAKGLAARLVEINTEVREVLTEMEEDPFSENGSTHTISKLKLGTFIFTGNDNNTGKLEDILLPLMQVENEENFNAASQYLDSHFDEARLFPLKLTVNLNDVAEERSKKAGDKEKYDEKKSLIGVVGQLQRSGKSNVVCISDSDYLSLEKIRANGKCVEISAFFNDFIS
ncbi:MAG TPA: DUF3226 domain-containing protein [Flavipsychrobacter sp.]|nr:DUF3226 domain-containing protein [Flavipsychrobacter sp.]